MAVKEVVGRNDDSVRTDGDGGVASPPSGKVVDSAASYD